MEMKIVETKENKILNRKEIEIVTDIDGKTLSKEEAKKEVSKFLNLNPEGMFIKSISQERGIKQCKITAHYYHNAKDIEKMEPKYLIERLSKKGGEKKEEKAVAK